MKTYYFKKSSQGFSLFLVMILMLVIAFLVVATSQSAFTESRLSSNEADRKIALARAEYGLGEAELFIKEALSANQTLTFKDDCTAGLCQATKGSFYAKKHKDPFGFDSSSSTEIDAWKRCANAPTTACESGKTVLDENTSSKKTADGNGRYIIEYMGTIDDTDTKEIFRITSKAKGKNDDTNVILQSYVELTRDN